MEVRFVASAPPLDYDYAVERIIEFIRDAVRRTGTRGVVIGLSGGVDSSVSAALAVKALGRGGVVGLILPDFETTPPEDVEDAEELAESLGIEHHKLDIHGIYETYGRLLPFFDEGRRVANGNLRARIRMTILYYYANISNRLVCGTSDKSELLLGYYTKYGDGGVDIMPIADLYKTQVRELARRLGLPRKLSEKPSSPRLWPGQMAESELGITYEEADQILYLYVDHNRSIEEIAGETGISMEKIKAVIQRVHRNEHKRVPPPIARVSKYTVGHDWKMPWNLG
ncbi:MAG: NAD+ synthase [Thaumarchaeota archaeon]|nr:NAD+ synthase [Nitrososphaerota archaeon]